MSVPSIDVPRVSHCPAELRMRPQWVTWQYERRGDRRTKVPRNPATGANASTTDPETWGTFDDALTACEWNHHHGVGYVFAANDPFFMLDLDRAFDLDMLHDWAREIVETFPGCYWEISPSGQGLRGIGRGTLPAGGNRKGQIEVYDHARFSTITGQVFDGHETIGADCTEALSAFHARLFRPVVEAGTAVEPPSPSPPLTDDEVLNRAFAAKNGEKLRHILSGDIGGYDSGSEADMAAVAMLRFWTQDAAQIERILRTSNLQREKWDKHGTYLRTTVEKVLSLPGETYTPPSNIVDIRKHLNGDQPPPGDQTTIEGFRLSDLGNGQRLAKRIQGKAHYCHPAKRWYVYDGTRWDDDDRGSLLTWAKASVLSMYEAAPALPDKERTELIKHALKSESERALKAAISLATSEDGVPVLPDEFDRDPMLLNVENGTIDLATGTLRAHDPADMLSKIAPVTFDPDATCPRFLAFLEQIFEGNDEQIRYVQKALGYTMTGKTTERAVFFLWGVGRNGKSTLLTVMASILGDYARKTPTETIMLKRGDSSGPSNDIAALKGARLVMASETEEGRRLNVAKVKDMSGNEKMTARFMYGEFFEFRPEFKLWIATNHKPLIPGNDRAIFDRFKLIPFTYRIPDDEIDRDIEAKLLAESAGILNWLLEGCRAWQAGGLTPPETVIEATEQYRQEMDQIGAFLADRCVLGPDYRVSSGGLYAAYKTWCETNGEKQNSATWFGRQLTEREFERIHDGPKRTRTWLGIGLVDDNGGGERVQPVQNANSGKVRYSISHEGTFPEKPVQTRSDDKPVHPSPQKETEADEWL